MSVATYCVHCGQPSCDCHDEPACEQCGAPTAEQCECSGYEAIADTDESLGLTDRKFAPF